MKNFGRGFGGGGSRGGYKGGGSRGGFGGGDRGERSMHQATCSQCGRDCQVPFRPTGSKPVYCSNCFDDVRESGERDTYRGGSRSNQYGGDRSYQNSGSDNQAQFDALHKKLDRILKHLQLNGKE